LADRDTVECGDQRQQQCPGERLADLLTTPFADPLLARPPQLEQATVLPGDTQAASCAADMHDHLDHGQPLTLSVAVDLALCHHPEVQGAWASIKIQAAQVGAARASYLPALNMGMSRSRQKSRIRNRTLRAIRITPATPATSR